MLMLALLPPLVFLSLVWLTPVLMEVLDAIREVRRGIDSISIPTLDWRDRPPAGDPRGDGEISLRLTTSPVTVTNVYE